MNLATLAVYAVTGPKFDVFVHFKPNKSFTHQFQSISLVLDGRVSEDEQIFNVAVKVGHKV